MKSTLVKACMIVQFFCINNIRSADNLTDHLFDDLLKIQLNTLDQWHAPLLKEHNYGNRLSWCWDLTATMNYRQKVDHLTSTAVNCVLAGANPNIASDRSQIRVLHLLTALTSIESVEYIEHLVVDHKANPFLKDADGNDAFFYAKQLESTDNLLYQIVVTALHKYKP